MRLGVYGGLHYHMTDRSNVPIRPFYGVVCTDFKMFPASREVEMVKLNFEVFLLLGSKFVSHNIIL